MEVIRVQQCLRIDSGTVDSGMDSINDIFKETIV